MGLSVRKSTFARASSGAAQDVVAHQRAGITEKIEPVTRCLPGGPLAAVQLDGLDLASRHASGRSHLLVGAWVTVKSYPSIRMRSPISRPPNSLDERHGIDTASFRRVFSARSARPWCYHIVASRWTSVVGWGTSRQLPPGSIRPQRASRRHYASNCTLGANACYLASFLGPRHGASSGEGSWSTPCRRMRRLLPPHRAGIAHHWPRN
jgi:hypothetical protein